MNVGICYADVIMILATRLLYLNCFYFELHEDVKRAFKLMKSVTPYPPFCTWYSQEWNYAQTHKERAISW